MRERESILKDPTCFVLSGEHLQVKIKGLNVVVIDVLIEER